MGNCECVNYGQNQFQQYQYKKQKFNQNLTPIIKKIEQKPQQYQNSMQNITPKFNQQQLHEPLPNFATTIDRFPSLSQKIIETDQKLGIFMPDNSQYFNHKISYTLIRKVYKLHNGVIYQGQWHNGSMNGNGVFCLPDGSFVRGFFINNELVGKIRYIRTNGNYYQGFVKNNKANGEGILFSDGITYKGVFVNNFLQGQGTQQSQLYNFKGTYSKGAKMFGRLVWDLDKSVQSYYQGGFFQEKFNGRGKLFNQIGQYEGQFQNGKKKGRGIFKWKNGERFQGYYDNDLKNGQGKMFNAKNIVVLQGNWKNNKFVE